MNDHDEDGEDDESELGRVLMTLIAMLLLTKLLVFGVQAYVFGVGLMKVFTEVATMD